MTANGRWTRFVVAVAVLLGPARCALAKGGQLDRFEPAAAGSWFFGVEHPWYSSTRSVAAGLTLDYGHDDLLGGKYGTDGKWRSTGAIVQHLMVGHVDVAGSFLDRVQLSLSAPAVLYASAEAADTPRYGAPPTVAQAIGDPRIGALVRLWRHADQDPISIHVGAYVWIPVSGSPSLSGDPSVRVMAQLVLAGVGRRHLRWSLGGGVLYRDPTSVGLSGSLGSELQLRAGLGYTDSARRYNVGPEVTIATAISGAEAFAQRASSVEVLLGAQWNIAHRVQLGAALGLGVLPTLGTPDVRAIFRAAWAPQPVRPRDSDDDGIPDAEDLCPEQPAGRVPDPARRGCAKDSDSDGVPDAEDLCPDAPRGLAADPKSKGCPIRDADGDGVPDAEDLCPNQVAGARPDGKVKGCPMKDSDGDGVPDAEDLCPRDVPGAHPDRRSAGCPMKDSDSDGVPDAEDVCPNLAGAVDRDPKKSGCPALDASSGSLTELRSVFFASNEATLLPESFPVLDELVRLLNGHPSQLQISIEGYTDDTGSDAWNLRLSRHRSDAVVEYLVRHGVARARLSSVGHGNTRPLSPDRTDEARARNRRVEMRIPEKR